MMLLGRCNLPIIVTSALLLALGTAVIAAAQSPVLQPGRVIVPADEHQENLLPNASFECGTAGWGSAENDVMPGWFGPMNSLFGRLDTTTSVHGRASLKIELTPETQPIAYCDYSRTQSHPIKSPLAANIGWIAVTRGKPYVFSVAMKAIKDNTPARLVVRQFCAAAIEKPVRVSTQWQRYQLAFAPDADAVYVLAGPELHASDGGKPAPANATVWLDALQLTAAPTNQFVTRRRVEMGIVTEKPGNVFSWTEPLGFHVTVAVADAHRPEKTNISLRLIDFLGKEVWRERVSTSVPTNSSRELDIVAPPSPMRRGFLRMEATMTSGSIAETRQMRLAVIPDDPMPDSRFGLNHAFGWPELLALSQRAGLVWNRNWSLKWQDVEPARGQFTFDQSDSEINRLLQPGFRVLGLAAFPASMWSSSAPASVQPPDPWYRPLTQSPDRERQQEEIAYERGSPTLRMGYAAREFGDFENYVRQTVAHYKGRIHDWQVFNEPVLTGYALSKANGYAMSDYVKHIDAFAKIARQADRKCRIVAGFSVPGWPAKKEHVLPAVKDFEPFFLAGGLKSIDVFTLHIYPAEPPEFIEALLQQLNAAMDRHGGRRPIWVTECAYYADDEPWALPVTNPCGHLASERDQAAYLVRMSTIFLANGVEKVFFHSGLGSGINHTNPWTMFLRYNGEPYQCYASHAIMARLLSPTCRFIKQIPLEREVRAYLFQDTTRALAVVWTPENAKTAMLRLSRADLQIVDLMGHEHAATSFAPSAMPCYLIGNSLSAADLEKALH
jgi:hypothetical protein